jgi:hypothetical protein
MNGTSLRRLGSAFVAARARFRNGSAKTSKMIISLHLPKTAGTSFAKSLKAQFGKALLKDYADLPINTPVYERNLNALQACIENGAKDFAGVQCIHGHFLPLKYLLLSAKREITFITWMRDPVERLASHYWFWRKTYKADTAPELQKRMVEEKWPLERFCLGSEFQNFYWQFLWGFPLERFDFIGIVENYEEDFGYFTAQFLGTRLPVYKKNLGGIPKLHITNHDFRKAIEAHHSIDMELYRRALEIRQKRCHAYREA